MRAFAIALLLVLATLQYRLWLSEDGIRSVVTLRASVKAQAEENAALTRRNDQLAAEVKDLKEGFGAVEERARTDLGMIGANESFFQVVEGAPHAVTAPAAASLPIQRTAR
jgi:cell division protein FtsB